MKFVCDKKVNVYCVILFVILAAYINFFYAFSNSLEIFGVIKISELDWMMTAAFFGVIVLKNFKFCIHNIPKIFVFVEIGIIALAILSSIQSYVLYEQPFLLGVRAQREQIIFPFLFLSFFFLFKLRKISKEEIIRTIYLFSIVEMSLGFIQFAFSDTPFLQVIGGVRYGQQRYLFNVDFIILTTMISCYSIFKKKHIVFNSIYSIIGVLFVAIVVKWRMVLMALLMSVFICLFIFLKISKRTKFVVAIAGGVLLLLILQLPIMKDVINVIFNGGSNDTAGIRDVGRQFYLETLKNHPILGGGFINILWEPSYYGSLYHLNVFWVDNGIFGYLFYYGGLGLLFIGLLYAWIIIKTFKILKKKDGIYLFSYVLYSIIALYTCLGLGMNATTIFPIILLLCSIECDEIKETSYFMENKLSKVEGEI